MRTAGLAIIGLIGGGLVGYFGSSSDLAQKVTATCFMAAAGCALFPFFGAKYPSNTNG